jgi:CheY-like chemotaxis protein
MADVLIVDDNEDLAALVAMILEGYGHGVRIAHDGAAGMEALAEGLPDLLVLDVDMPVLDGPGMAYRMLVEDCGRELIPIVLLSGTMDLVQVARRIGTPYVLAKPCEPDRLLRVIDRAIAERTAPRPTA